MLSLKDNICNSVLTAFDTRRTNLILRRLLLFGNKLSFATAFDSFLSMNDVLLIAGEIRATFIIWTSPTYRTTINCIELHLVIHILSRNQHDQHYKATLHDYLLVLRIKFFLVDRWMFYFLFAEHIKQYRIFLDIFFLVIFGNGWSSYITITHLYDLHI